MAKKIIWSLNAQRDRKNILLYWNKRNKSNRYSIKLNKLFTDAIKIVSKYPGIGKLTDKENIRIKIVKDYLIIYEDIETEIHILTIWDSRRDSENLEY